MEVILEGCDFGSDTGHCPILLCVVTEKEKENVYSIHGMLKKRGTSLDRALHACVST